MWQEAAALRDFNPTFVRFGSKADIEANPCDVRFTPVISTDRRNTF